MRARPPLAMMRGGLLGRPCRAKLGDDALEDAVDEADVAEVEAALQVARRCWCR